MKSKAWSLDEAFSDVSEESGSDFEVEPETPITAPQTPLPTGSKTLHCPYKGCTKSFNRQARLTEHIRSHTNERPFTCPEEECNKAFLRDSHLKHHIKSAHTNQRNYPCTWTNCDKKFATGTRLRRHEASHQTKEKYTCKGYEGCNETFRKHATLSRHILSVHENRKPFPCTELDAATAEQCLLRFDTAEKLRSHKRAVHDQTRFICSDCSPPLNVSDKQVSFTTYALLQEHITVFHPPSCPQCSLVCTSEKELRRHLELLHDVVDEQAEKKSDPSFPCTYPSCTRSFTKKGNLNVHVKTVHEHRKDFVCGETELKLPLQELQKGDAVDSQSQEIIGCGRHFTSKATLEEHVRTAHLGMNSKRAERNKKRRAERVAKMEEVDIKNGRTKRRKQTRGGISTIAELTGSAQAAVTAAFESESAIRNPFHQTAYQAVFSSDFYQDFDTQALLQDAYDPFLIPSEQEEQLFPESNLGAGLPDLTASTPLDPVLLLEA